MFSTGRPCIRHGMRAVRITGAARILTFAAWQTWCRTLPGAPLFVSQVALRLSAFPPGPLVTLALVHHQTSMPQAVGRPPWTTPDQLKYLQNYLSELDYEKARNSLAPFYARVARDFSIIWKPPVDEKDREQAKDEDELKKLTYECRGRVSCHLLLPFKPPLTITTPANRRMVQKAPQDHHRHLSAQACF